MNNFKVGDEVAQGRIEHLEDCPGFDGWALVRLPSGSLYYYRVSVLQKIPEVSYSLPVSGRALAGINVETYKMWRAGWPEIPEFKIPDLKCPTAPKSCECGAHAIGCRDNAPGHSTWCPVAGG